MFYVILFGVLALLLLAAGVMTVSRQRQRFRDAGMDDHTYEEEEELP